MWMMWTANTSGLAIIRNSPVTILLTTNLHCRYEKLSLQSANVDQAIKYSILQRSTSWVSISGSCSVLVESNRLKKYVRRHRTSSNRRTLSSKVSLRSRYPGLYPNLLTSQLALRCLGIKLWQCLHGQKSSYVWEKRNVSRKPKSH